MDKNPTEPSARMTSAATDVKDDVPAKSNVVADVDTTMPDTITAATSDNSSSSNGVSRSTASTGSTRLLPARLRQAPVTFVPTFQGSFVRRRPGSATDVTVNQEEQAHDSGTSSGSNNSSNQPYAAAQQRSQLRAPQRSRQLRGNASTATATTTGATTITATAAAAAAAAAATADADVSDGRVRAVDSDDELISDIINNSKYASSNSSSSATKGNTDLHKKQQHLKSGKVKVSHSRVGDLYQALKIPLCRSAAAMQRLSLNSYEIQQLINHHNMQYMLYTTITDYSTPTIAVTQERPQLSSAATTASTVLWDLSKAPEDSDIDELLVRLKLNKRGQQPRRPITHALVYTALVEANYDITAAEAALVPYGHTLKSFSSTNSHHELPTTDTAVTVTVNNNDSKSAAATKTSHSTTAINILAETAATDAVSVSESAHQSREQSSVTDTTVSGSTAATSGAIAAAVGSSQPAHDKTDVETDDVNVATQVEQQQSSTEQLCTNYTAADTNEATAATGEDSFMNADTADTVVATAMDVDTDTTPSTVSATAATPAAAVAAVTAVTSPLQVRPEQQQAVVYSVTDTIGANATESQDTNSTARTAMDVDTTADKPNDDVTAEAVTTVTAAAATAAAGTTSNSGGSSSSSVTAVVLRKSSKGKNKAILTAAANKAQTTNDDSVRNSGSSSSSSSSTTDSSSTSSTNASSSAITVISTIGHKLGIEYTNTANTMTSWTADERNRFVQEGLLVVGKDLSAIAAMLGFKTRADVVEFYYNWKNQNVSYRQWVEHRKLMSVEDVFPDSYPETCSGCNQHGDLL
eukprot:9855-Heterococcus_DN1.PRE.3